MKNLVAVDQDKLFQELGLTSSHQTMIQKKKQAKQNEIHLINSQQDNKRQNNDLFEIEDIISLNNSRNAFNSQQSTLRQQKYNYQDNSFNSNSFGFQQNIDEIQVSQRASQRSGKFNQMSPKLPNMIEINDTFSSNNFKKAHTAQESLDDYANNQNIKEEDEESDQEDDGNFREPAGKSPIKNMNISDFQQEQQLQECSPTFNEQDELNIILVLELPNGQSHEVSYKLSDDVEEIAFNIAAKFNIKKQGCEYIIKLLKESKQQFLREIDSNTNDKMIQIESKNDYKQISNQRQK